MPSAVRRERVQLRRTLETGYCCVVKELFAATSPRIFFACGHSSFRRRLLKMRDGPCSIRDLFIADSKVLFLKMATERCVPRCRRLPRNPGSGSRAITIEILSLGLEGLKSRGTDFLR